jgi:glucokinase
MARSTSQRLIGLDLGGTSVKAGAISPAGEVLSETSAATNVEQGPESVLDLLAELARELGAERELGIGVPGLLDRARGIVLESPNFPGFREFDVRGGLARRLGLAPERVVVENDANAAALGEQWLGAARGERDVLVLTLGTGIGSGLILDGRLVVGAGLAAEAGHLVIEPSGPICGCGSRGCVEQFASASAARRRAIEAGLPAGDPGDLELLTERARAGARAERELLFEIGRDLGHMVAAVLCLLDVRLFVFGGGFSAALDQLEPGLRVGADERSFGARSQSLRLLRAGLGTSAGWIGAARPLAGA